MKIRRRSPKQYNNDVRLPIILFIIIVGGLVGTRWMYEVQVQHLAQRLDRESRQLERDNVELQGHLKDLEGRAFALLARDAVNTTLATKGITMQEIKKGEAILLRASPPAVPTPVNQAPVKPPSPQNIAQAVLPDGQ